MHLLDMNKMCFGKYNISIVKKNLFKKNILIKFGQIFQSSISIKSYIIYYCKYTNYLVLGENRKILKKTVFIKHYKLAVIRMFKTEYDKDIKITFKKYIIRVNVIPFQ